MTYHRLITAAIVPVLGLALVACDDPTVPDTAEHPTAHDQTTVVNTALEPLDMWASKPASESTSITIPAASLLPDIAGHVDQVTIDAVLQSQSADESVRKTPSVTETLPPIWHIPVINVSDCRYTGCANEGRCVVGEERSSCVCPKGFIGTQCEVEISADHSATSPESSPAPEVDHAPCDHAACEEGAGMV